MFGHCIDMDSQLYNCVLLLGGCTGLILLILLDAIQQIHVSRMVLENYGKSLYTLCGKAM